MRMLFALVAGVAITVMPGTRDCLAQDFKVEDAATLDGQAVSGLKPKTIVFADKPTEELIDAGTGFMRYEDWAKAKPVEQKFLSLYRGYTEPNEDIIVDGAKKRFREKLHMYVAQARFLISRPAASLDLASLATLPFIEKMDPQIKQRLVTADDPKLPKEPKVIHNQNPQRRWCEDRPGAICIYSTYKLEGRLPIGIQLANKIRESAKKISDTLEFESEVAFVPPADAAGFAELTGVDTPAAGALEQSIFYVNEVMQFGKLLAVFQQHPADADKTVASVFISLAVESNILVKRKDLGKIPVLRNLIPAQVLSGKSSFNTGNSLSAGLPVYARNRVKAIAEILDRK